MKVLITGICGFVGSSIARSLRERVEGVEIFGVDNLVRRGSETNLSVIRKLKCGYVHGDIRNDEDVAELPVVDWVIDCAANPSVLAGVTGGVRQVVAHNLAGTLNLLEKCHRDGAGFLMLSSSRVYSIDRLNQIPIARAGDRFMVREGSPLPPGMTRAGVSESFSTEAPVSIYGATKLASEVMALEYGSAYGFPVRVNRCAVIAGSGQFGRADQGVFSYWIYQWMQRKPLSYLGYGGEGLQVRDLLASSDLARLVVAQLLDPGREGARVLNVGGGADHSASLRELSAFCHELFGPHRVMSVADNRAFDIPYYVTDNALVTNTWGWRPEVSLERTLTDIATWAKAHENDLASFSG